MNPTLYQAILDRKSVRHYLKEPLSASQMIKIKAVSNEIQSIHRDKKVKFFFMDTPEKSDLVTSMGGYGRILDAPHFAIPFIEDFPLALLELGYQTQQFVNLVTMIEGEESRIGTCYIGAIHRDATPMHEKFEIPMGNAIAAAVLFGKPKQMKRRTFVNQMRKPGSSSPRKSFNEIFYQVDLEIPSLIEDEIWGKILKAAQRAPSAGNAQPWRMIVLENEITLYADPQAYIPLLRGVGKTYAIHDMGILMANINMACRSMEKSCTWKIIDGFTENKLVFGEWTAVAKGTIS